MPRPVRCILHTFANPERLSSLLLCIVTMMASIDFQSYKISMTERSYLEGGFNSQREFQIMK